MCGIAGYVGERNGTEVVLDGLRRLEYRGYDSAGISYLSQDKIETIRAVGKVVELAKKLDSTKSSNVAIGHTRWATHGGVTEVNAHPHLSYNGKVSIVHNGIIDNCDAIVKFLSREKVSMASETDSEVIAHLIAKYYEELGSPRKAIEAALKCLEGTYGLAIIFIDQPGIIYAARNGSPLILGMGDKENMVASDTSAVLKYTNRVYYLEDGEIAELTSNNMSVWSAGKKHREPSATEIDQSLSDIETGSFPHFMLKEIFEQPQAISRCFGGRLRENTCILGGLNLPNDELAKITSVTIFGCGTSYHAGLVARYYIERYCGVPCSVELASEFANRKIIPDVNGIYLAISQSGETYDTIECIKELQGKGCRVFGIVNVVGSTIARMCGAGVYIHAGPEIAVASTKAFSTQLTALLMFSSMLGRTKGMGAIEGKFFVEEMRGAKETLESMLKTIPMEQLSYLGYILSKQPYVLFLGRGPSYPVALEGALKLKEIAYIPSDSYAAGEMKHGPIAMIDEGTKVICIVPPDEHRRHMITAIKEIQARGGDIIAIADKEDEEIKSLCPFFIGLPYKGALMSPLLSIVPLQLMAYHAALAKGTDVDKPRNLAKSVVVN